jgi:hypothetical protein
MVNAFLGSGDIFDGVIETVPPCQARIHGPDYSSHGKMPAHCEAEE